jgi:hypothetical protein
MEQVNITMLEDLVAPNVDYTIKVRIIRLWKQPSHHIPGEFYSIDMILMDEEVNFNIYNNLPSYCVFLNI